MKNKKSILVLLLLLVSTYSILIASTTDITNYKRYNVLELNSSQVDGAMITSSNGVALPIIATYNPDSYELYSVASSLNESVSKFNLTNINTYNTQDYDITTAKQTEKFTLHYTNNLEKLKFSYVNIYYDKEFYSTDRTKQTGVLLGLNYNSLLEGNSIQLMPNTTGNDITSIYTLSEQSLNYASFQFKMQKGYHDTSLLDFYFYWTPTSIDVINEELEDVFISGEKLVAYVFIEVIGV